MRIGVLTSSRADYGIYLPLLKKMKEDDNLTVEIIAFGTHLSRLHGFTIDDIKSDGFHKIHAISSLLSNDDSVSVASSYALTASKFSDFWNSNVFDIVLCLGDRFEMSAAVQAGIPFKVLFAHIAGGETTLGAIDNIYRHQITLASKIHFTTSSFYKQRVEEITGDSENIYNIGSLSLNGINEYKPIDKDLFYSKYQISDGDFALVTFHPETQSNYKIEASVGEMIEALTQISQELSIIVTMPNADTLSSVYRDKLIKLKSKLPNRVLLVENFGKENYFSAMYYSKIMIGNTSSGIVEGASFKKYVVNVGDRQKGRVQSSNTLNAMFKADDILEKTKKALSLGEYLGDNIYYKENSVENIIKVIKQYDKL